MKPHVIDTNVLVTFVTDRDPPARKIVAGVFRSAAALKEELYLVSNVITEFVYVLTSVYHLEPARVRSMIVDLLDTPGVVFHHGYHPEAVFRLWPAAVRDYGDAVVAAAASALGCPVYTADTRFAGELTRIGVAVELLR